MPGKERKGNRRGPVDITTSMSIREFNIRKGVAEENEFEGVSFGTIDEDDITGKIVEDRIAARTIAEDPEVFRKYIKKVNDILDGQV